LECLCAAGRYLLGRHRVSAHPPPTCRPPEATTSNFCVKAKIFYH